MYRKLYFIGIVAYMFMLALSILFYKERILFLDSSFVLFHLIREGSFCIAIYRFGDAIAQVLPLLSFKMGLSLDAIIKSYSVGFVLYYIICYLVCGSLLKQYRFALVILLINLLFAAHTFYWPVSQVPQGMALVMVVFALIWERTLATMHIWRWVALTLLMITITFFHPLMLFALGYTMIFFFLSDYSKIDKKVLLSIAVFYISLLVVKSLFFRVEYEKHSLSGLKNFIKLFPDYFTIYANREFLRNCLTKYYWIPLLFTGIAILYKQKRAYLKLGLFVVGILGYLMLVNIMYPSSETPQYYIENLYLPIALFLGLPFVFDVLPLLEQKKAGIAIVSLILLTGSIRLYASHGTYSARLAWERQYLDKYGQQKVMLKATEADREKLQMLWGTPFEFLLLSECERNKPASIVIDENPGIRYWAAWLNNALIVNWNVYAYKDLNPKYFHFTDSTTSYIIYK